MVLTVLGVAVLVGALAAIGGTAAPATQVLDSRRDQIRTLEAEVQRIDESARTAADAHAAAVRRADDLRARIAATNASLAEARRAHAVSVQRLSDRVVALYRTEDPSLMEIVLSSGDLSDALDAQQALEQIGVNDRRIVAQLEGTRARLSGLRAELESSRAGVEANVREKADRLADLEGLIADRRAALDEARTALDALIRQEERRQAVAAARQRAAAAAAAAEESAERDLLRRAGAEPATPTTPATPAAPRVRPRPRAALRRRRGAPAADRPVRVGGQPDRRVVERALPRQVPVRRQHLGGPRRHRRPRRRPRGRAGPARRAPLRAQRPRPVARLRVPVGRAAGSHGASAP